MGDDVDHNPDRRTQLGKFADKPVTAREVTSRGFIQWKPNSSFANLIKQLINTVKVH